MVGSTEARQCTLFGGLTNKAEPLVWRVLLLHIVLRAQCNTLQYLHISSRKIPYSRFRHRLDMR